MNFDARQGSTLLNTYNLDVVVSVDEYWNFINHT